jgi:hypothetical protein
MYLLDCDFCGALADYTFGYRHPSANPHPASPDEAVRAQPSSAIAGLLRLIARRNFCFRRARNEGHAR